MLDAHAIAAATFQLWVDRGYANVNWADIAQATGISSRTLSRHFDTKSAIAWYGTVAATNALREALAQMPADIEINEALSQAIAASIESSNELTTTGKLWLKVVANEPALIATAARAYAPWIEELVAFLKSRLPHLPHHQHVAIANAVQASSFSVMLSQADVRSDQAPTSLVRETLKHIRIVP